MLDLVRLRRQALVWIACAAVGVCSSNGKEADPGPRPARVRVAAATLGPERPAIETSGVVANKEEARLSFKITGLIDRITVEEGQTVKAGQLLARVELTEIQAQVEQARLAADKAQRDLARGEKLAAENLISEQQLQDLRTQAQLTRAQLDAAEFNLRHAAIHAPGDGVVLRKLAEEREWIPAGQPVLVLGLRSRGYVVRTALADREVVQLKLGDPAEIRLDAWPGETLPGTVSEIASAADIQTGLFPAEVSFDAPPASLASGMVAHLRLYPAAARNESRTYVPIASVIEGEGDRAVVFVVDGDKALRREVKVAFIAPDSVALAAGLRPGERVVTDGARYLEDGQQIEIVQAPQEENPAP